MAIFEFKLPDLGEGIVEGEIVEWLVAEGDELAEDQSMVEVMTDKATVVIPSPRRGKVLKLHGREGDIAQVHHALVTLEVEDAPAAAAASDASEKSAPAVATPSPAAATQIAPGGASEGAKVLATPVTRRIAREHGVELSGVQGSGPNGRVLKADVLRVVSGGAAVAVPETPAGGETAEVVAPRREAAPAAKLAEAPGDERIPLRGLRRLIARKMVTSKFTAPHYTFVEELDATELKALRQRLNARLEAGGDTLRLSYLPFFCKAVAAAMRRHPMLNANFDEAAQELVVRKSVNLGIAVATEEGLTVPVVKDVQSKSLRALAEEIGSLASGAREKRLRPEDLTGGTFTLTSLGQQGGLFATPIINHPEVAILGIHRIRQQPVVRGGQIVIRDIANVSLSFDHRVIDGAIGAAFSYEVIRYLENPELLMVELA